MNKEDLLQAIEDLHRNYDAYFFENKYGKNTHEKQFKMLTEYFKNDETSMKALEWIQHCYDCYYYEDFNDDKSAFAYLKKKLELED